MMKIRYFKMASSSSPSSLLGTIEDLKLTAGPVRRSLFGPVDHQQLQQDFQTLLSVSAEEASQRWSYDFQSDRPAQGSTVEWEELRCQDVPAFYRSCLVKRGGGGGGGGGGGARAAAAAGAGAALRAADAWCQPESPGSSCSSGEEYLEVTTRGYYRLQRPEKRTAGLKAFRCRQASITDFYSVKKPRLLHHKRPSRR